MGTSKEYSIVYEIKGKVFEIRSTGLLGESAGQEFEQRVNYGLEQKLRHFVFDFGHAKSISSPAIASILNSTEAIVEEHKGKVCLTGLTELNLKVFEMVGILLSAEVCVTLPEAEIRVLLEDTQKKD
ncbi:MAG: hypothetical protein HQM09_02120 [Candidatus Riflebacteria bacterium]|nr:hypothetical protein [Candidatus Riflebacteria bacterium]